MCAYWHNRFMRGERDTIMAAYRAALRGDATPNTPSTASSSVRQNPLTYQRMHSNDSDKEKDSGRASDWLDAASSGNTNGTSKSDSSPNQKQKWLTTTLPSGGRINKATKPYSNRSNMKANRSHGNDDHLTEEVSEIADKIADQIAHNYRPIVNDTSKSDDDTTNNSNTKTDDNKSLNVDLNRSEDSIGSSTSLNNTVNSEPNPSGSSSLLNQDDTKSSSTTSSAQYSITDNSEHSEPKRTLLNKYVKKVKLLMKK